MDKELNETELAAMEMINRFKSNQKIYEEYLKFVDDVCTMIKCDFMLNVPQTEQELSERIVKALKFTINRHRGCAFLKNLQKDDMNMIGALILGLIDGEEDK